MTYEEAKQLAIEARDLAQQIQDVKDGYTLELKKAQDAHKKIVAAIKQDTQAAEEEVESIKAKILEYHNESVGHETIPYISFRGAGKLVCLGVDMREFIAKCLDEPEWQKYLALNEKEVANRLELCGQAHGFPESVIIDKAVETVVLSKK